LGLHPVPRLGKVGAFPQRERLVNRKTKHAGWKQHAAFNPLDNGLQLVHTRQPLTCAALSGAPRVWTTPSYSTPGGAGENRRRATAAAVAPSIAQLFYFAPGRC